MNEININETFELFKPESCIFVISIDAQGRPNGMINAWHMKVSREPALFAISLSKNGYTHKLIQQSKEFVIAIANKELEKEVLFFGTTHGNEVDKFKETRIETIKAKFIKSPLIKKATINLECVLEKEIEAGDHIIFIGKILNSYMNPGKKVLLGMRKINNDKRIFQEF
ncbi:MAG: flavin reductase family protein [Patescibacteria group bacterium]|jgi:flavin reductase (DIM6/NTAB) family NADH-FMN oxidoreductase RutF